MEMIENAMVVDWWWEFVETGSEYAKEKLKSPGYTEMGTGVFVPEEDAFDYAIEHCVKHVPHGLHDIEWTQEFKDMLVDWFFAENWIWSGGVKW